MRILTYLAIAFIGGFIGYKMAEIYILNKKLAKNILPIVSEIKIQIIAIDSRLKEEISPEEKTELEKQKQKLLTLLNSFYGYEAGTKNALSY